MIAPVAAGRWTVVVSWVLMLGSLGWRARARKAPRTTYEAFVAKVGGFLRRRGFDFDVTAAATRQAWTEVQDTEPGSAGDASES